MIAINVAVSIPPITPVPIECLLAAPAPPPRASGKTPIVNASEVMIIGLSLTFAASSAESTRVNPSFLFCSANSTIKIAFLAASPARTNKPIWK